VPVYPKREWGERRVRVGVVVVGVEGVVVVGGKTEEEERRE